MSKMYKPEDIQNDADVRRIGLELLQKHAAELPNLVNDEVNRWTMDFVSDDGTDYVKAALSITETLVHIVYEGSAADLRFFLFHKAGDDWELEQRSIDALAYEACDGISKALYPYYIQATEE